MYHLQSLQFTVEYPMKPLLTTETFQKLCTFVSESVRYFKGNKRHEADHGARGPGPGARAPTCTRQLAGLGAKPHR